MKRMRKVRSRVIPGLCFGCILCSSTSAAPIFTGNVTTDFLEPSVFTAPDIAGVDVGIPLAFPAGTISGNDVQDVRLAYDYVTDTLYISINSYVIAGDVDGDGDPGRTSTTLGSLGGIDVPDFGGSESFSVMLDINEDGTFDIIAGVSALTNTTGFSVNRFSGTPFVPAYAYATPLSEHMGDLFASPSASMPDVEFTIENFSMLPYSGPDMSDAFGMGVFVGSFSDAGIGEDFLPASGGSTQICFDGDADGYTICNGDCNDENSGIHPGAAEVCDGSDNDCSGVVDDVPDGDGDGYNVCAGDCNDQNGGVHPGATEACNGTDDDCDGQTDEGFDQDGDGYTVCNGDCNDSNGDIHPGAIEICDDIDNDCDGLCCEDGRTVTGIVFLDIDQDGMQDMDEVGIEGAQVQIDGPDCDLDGDADSTIVETDEDGRYMLDALCEGTFTVTFLSGLFDDVTSENPQDVELNASGQTVYADFGTFRAYITRAVYFWAGAACTTEDYLPIRVGDLVFNTVEDVASYLNRQTPSDAQRELGRQILSAKVNVAIFGVDAYTWSDLDGDGLNESVAELIDDAEYAFDSRIAREYLLWSFELLNFNVSGNYAATPDYFPTCALP